MAYAKNNISNISLRSEPQTTTLWVSWTKSSRKKSYDNGKTGNNKKVYYKFKEYKVKWEYWVPKVKTSYIGSETSVTNWSTTYNSYSYPANANKVKVTVTLVYEKVTKDAPKFKPLTASYTANATGFTPEPPSSVSHDMNDTKLVVTAEVSQSEITNKKVDQVWFTFYQGTTNSNGVDSLKEVKTNKVNLNKTTRLVSTYYTLDPGYFYRYKVLAYTTTYEYKSESTNLSQKVYTHASKPTNFSVAANAQNSATLSFYVKGHVEGYEVQYATEEKYLNTSSEFAQSKSWPEDDTNKFEHSVTHIISDLETGQHYFFRVRATSGNFGNSSWSDIVPLIIGREPGPPSTYSSKTAAEVGETVTLYWVHNTQDGSSQTQAQIALYMNTDTEMIGQEPITYNNPYINDEYNKDKTLSYPISLTTNSHYDVNNNQKVWDFKDGDVLYWKVRTRGVYSGKSGTNAERFSRLFVDANDNQSVVLVEAPTTINSFAIGIGSILSPIMIDVPSIHYSILNNVLTIYPTVLSVLNSEDPQYNTRIQFHIGYSYYTNGYGDWSDVKQISMYQQPEAHLLLKTNWEIDPENPDDISPIEDVEPTDVIDSYPLAVVMSATPSSQEIVSFNLTISNAGEAYESWNSFGEPITIGPNEIIYQRFFDEGFDDATDNDEAINRKTLLLYPSDVTFQDGERYNFTLEAYMNSGLSNEAYHNNTLASIEDNVDFEVEATIQVDPETMTAVIQPVCYDAIDESQIDPEDEEGSLPEFNEERLTQNVLMDVYRRETDGTMTLIENNIANTGWASIPDPHPSLDYARYRIVARKTHTAKAAYGDYEEEMGVYSLVIQWDQTWVDYISDYSEAAENFEDNVDEAAKITAVYNDGLLVLPWNVDTSEDYKPDVAMVEYIGREHPVSYYGTQRGQTASWSTIIDKQDKETLFKLRRLSRYMGDCYVREPSGTGYWANVQVNWSQTHNEPAIPISINVTRVEAHSYKDTSEEV